MYENAIIKFQWKETLQAPLDLVHRYTNIAAKELQTLGVNLR